MSTSVDTVTAVGGVDLVAVVTGKAIETVDADDLYGGAHVLTTGPARITLSTPYGALEIPANYLPSCDLGDRFTIRVTPEGFDV